MEYIRDRVSAVGRKLPLKLSILLEIERPLLVKADGQISVAGISCGTTALHSIAADELIGWRQAGDDPKRTFFVAVFADGQRPPQSMF